MTKTLRALVVLITSIGSNAYAAGVGYPVMDVGAWELQMQQLVAWGKQYLQMQEQMVRMEQTYKSLNGVHNFAQLANNPELSNYLPPKYQEVLGLARQINYGAYNGLGGKVKEFIAAAKIVGIDGTHLDPKSDAGKAFQNNQTQAALNRALAEESYNKSNERIANIKTLSDKIDTSSDNKEILDLQARISIEIAQLQNESNRIAALAQLQQAQRDIAAQQASEISIKALNSPIPRF